MEIINRSISVEELKEIFTELGDYKRIRKLSIDKQKEGLAGNLFEELSEYARAKSDEEKIDALCDIFVFTANTMPHTDHKIKNKDEFMYPMVVYDKDPKEIPLARIAGGVVLILREEAEIIRMNLLETCLKAMYNLGYDPVKAMKETIKEISSRKGHWDDKIKKFVKDPGVYSEKELEDVSLCVEYDEKKNKFLVTDIEGRYHWYVDKWYKADYKSCKLHG